MGTLLRTNVRKQHRLMLLLAMVAGCCDSYGLLHFKIYVSFMSGNTTQAGFSLGHGNFTAAGLALTAILFFLMGILVSALITEWEAYRKRWMPFVIVASLIILCAILNAYLALSNYSGTALLSFAMGYLNNTLMHVGKQAANPDFVTGNLNAGVRHFANALLQQPLDHPQGKWDTHRYRAAVLLSIWGCFLVGAFCYSFLETWLSHWAILLPASALLLCPLYIHKNPAILNN